MQSTDVHSYESSVDKGVESIVISRHSGAIPPDELIAALDGEASPDVLEQLRAAPDSAAELDALTHLQSTLQRRLYRFDCPDPHELGEYALDLVPPWRRPALAAHLSECPRCADEVAVFRGFLADASTPVPPTPVVRVRRLVASLFIPAPATVFTMRGEDASSSLHFRADDVELKLDISPVARRDAHELAGLIWREDSDATPVEGQPINLFTPDGTARSAMIDDLGNFAFAGLVPGTYHLEVALADELIATEDFQVGD
jgi:hypothetical protein